MLGGDVVDVLHETTGKIVVVFHSVRDVQNVVQLEVAGFEFSVEIVAFFILLLVTLIQLGSCF